MLWIKGMLHPFSDELKFVAMDKIFGQLWAIHFSQFEFCLVNGVGLELVRRNSHDGGYQLFQDTTSIGWHSRLKLIQNLQKQWQIDNFCHKNVWFTTKVSFDVRGGRGFGLGDSFRSICIPQLTSFIEHLLISKLHNFNFDWSDVSHGFKNISTLLSTS